MQNVCQERRVSYEHFLFLPTGGAYQCVHLDGIGTFYRDKNVYGARFAQGCAGVVFKGKPDTWRVAEPSADMQPEGEALRQLLDFCHAQVAAAILAQATVAAAGPKG